jgi:hypothetical protein
MTRITAVVMGQPRVLGLGRLEIDLLQPSYKSGNIAVEIEGPIKRIQRGFKYINIAGGIFCLGWGALEHFFVCIHHVLQQ